MAAAHVISTERFIVGGTNGRERNMSQVSDEKVKRMPRARLLLGCVSCDVLCVKLICPLSGVPCLPFYRPRGSRGYRWEKEEETKGREGLRGSRVFLFPCACPTNMVDRVRDGVFTDPYRAVPWPLSASECVPSYAGEWCGMSEGQATTLRGVDGEVTLCPSL